MKGLYRMVSILHGFLICVGDNVGSKREQPNMPSISRGLAVTALAC
jgi:hypothetical protein